MIVTTKEKRIGTDRYVIEYFGLSTDVKPTGKINGSTFYEMDTKKVYMYNEDANTWVEQ